MKEELKVSKIMEGTVIDHIRAGLAPLVLRILGIECGFPESVIVAMNVRSSHYGRKDIVKVERQFLDEETINKIAIISPQATINIIKDYHVVEKHLVELPDELVGIVRCPNRHCITNSREGVETVFRTEHGKLRCHYCEELVDIDEVELYER
ncbi:MAG: aspartate carbamoyltransferase regulatory subunit [Candidatus Bipolaricaulia bacterium]